MNKVADIIYIHGVLNNNPRSFINSISQFHQTLRSRGMQVLGYDIGDSVPVFWGDSPFQHSSQYEFMSNNIAYTNKAHNGCKSDLWWKAVPADFIPFMQQGSLWTAQIGRKSLYDFSFDQIWMIQDHWRNTKILFEAITDQINTQVSARRPFFVFAHSGGTIAIVKYLSDYSADCLTKKRKPNPYFEEYFKGLVTFGSPVNTFLSEKDIDEAASYIQRQSACWINVIEQHDPIATVITTVNSPHIKNYIHKTLLGQFPFFVIGPNVTNAHNWYWDHPEAFIRLINTDTPLSPVPPPQQQPDLGKELLKPSQIDQINFFTQSNQSTRIPESRLTEQKVSTLTSLRIVYITRNYNQTMEAQKRLKRSHQIDTLHQTLLGQPILSQYRITGAPIKIMNLGGSGSPIDEPGRYERVMRNIAWTNRNCGAMDGKIRKGAHQVFYNQLWLLENTPEAISGTFLRQIDLQLQEAGLLEENETPFLIIAHGTGAAALLQYLNDALLAKKPVINRSVLDRDLKGITLFGPLANVTLNHAMVIKPIYDYLEKTGKRAFNLIERQDIFASALTSYNRPSSLTDTVIKSHDQILQRVWQDNIPLIGMLPIFGYNLWNADAHYWKSGNQILKLFS